MRVRVWCAILIAVAAIQTVGAQSDGEWAVTDSWPLVELVGEAMPRMPILSPDGAAIAYEQRGESVCVYRFAGDETDCFPWPEGSDLSTSHITQPVWSADSRYIAYTPNVFQFLIDSDIWTLDAESGEFTNQTDDGFSGSFFGQSVTETPPLDYLPTWNPATNELYFLRSRRIATIGNSDGYSTELHKIDAGGEDTLVHNLTHRVPGPLAVYMPLAFSPGGEMLAFIAMPPDWPDDSGSGVWTLELASGDLEQVAGMEAFSGPAPWYDRPLWPTTIHWAGDNLVVLAVDNGARGAPLNIPYYIDLESGDVTALLDYREFETKEALDEYRDAGVSPYSAMVQGVSADDGSAYFALVAAPQAGQAGLYAFPLPPSAGEPRLLETVEFVPLPGAEARPILAADGRMLLHATVFQLERQP